MHKVVIERPRWNPGPGKNGRRQNLSDEQLPKFEGIKRPHRHRKGLTDLLGPLKRWLQAQVGRSWNDVYSEACAVIKPDSVIRAHVKTHLLQFVEQNTFMHKGIVCVLDTNRTGGPVPVVGSSWRWPGFFVHPETGLLQVSRNPPRIPEPEPPITMRWLRKGVALKQIRGLWFECHFEVVPVDVRFRAYDHALERVVVRGELTRNDRAYYLCVLKRQLSGKALRKLGLTNSQSAGATGTQRSNVHRNERLNIVFLIEKTSTMEAVWQTTHMNQKTHTSKSQANDARGSRLRRGWAAAPALCTGIKSCARSSAATTCVRAVRASAFKKCCLRSGRYDGARRNYFFPRMSFDGSVGLWGRRYRTAFKLSVAELTANWKTNQPAARPAVRRIGPVHELVQLRFDSALTVNERGHPHLVSGSKQTARAEAQPESSLARNLNRDLPPLDGGRLLRTQT